MLSLWLVVAVLAALWLFRSTRKPKNFPPGPPNLPLVGSYPFFYKKSSLSFSVRNLVKKYGPVSGFTIGSQRVVVIADFEIMKNVMKRDEASQRPPNRPNNETRPGWRVMAGDNEGRPPGVLGSGGNYWKEQRRFMLRNLKDFGFGKSSMESLIQDEMVKLCSRLSQLPEGEPIDLNRTMNLSIINALWVILVGEKFELDDPKLAEVVQLFDDLFRKTAGTFSPFASLLPHPSMAKWPIINKFFYFDQSKKTFDATQAVIGPYISEHKRTLDKDNIRDFVDLALVEIANTHDPESGFYDEKGYFSLFNGMIDLFLAGMETTSTSLMWTFLFLLHHPEVQAKVHKELDEVVGRNRYPSLADQPKLHYLNAVLQESFRTASLVGAGVPHYTTEDISVGGFDIPKGTIIYSSLYHVMNDEEHFKDPHLFRPERFVDENGNFVTSNRVIPFGIGKRICLGQTLAEKEFFIFFSGMIQQFSFEAPKGHQLPSYDYNASFPTGSLRTIPSYKVVLKKRFNH